ncbi:MAG: methylmalonyl-CoA mutase family protein [Phascolarctobacterium faecium]
MDEAIALPTISRLWLVILNCTFRTTKVCKVIDPWGGSYYVEALTNQLIQKPGHISEIEQLGGMSSY